jgi:hypothetical protein
VAESCSSLWKLDAVLDEDERSGRRDGRSSAAGPPSGDFLRFLLRYTSSIPIGGDLVRRTSVRVEVPRASEEIKKSTAAPWQVPGVPRRLLRRSRCRRHDQRELTRMELASISKRDDRDLPLGRRELRQLGLYNSLGAGLVLTGGGIAARRRAELAQSVIGLRSGSVRQGLRRPVASLRLQARHGVGWSSTDRRTLRTSCQRRIRSGHDRIKDFRRRTEWVSRYFLKPRHPQETRHDRLFDFPARQRIPRRSSSLNFSIEPRKMRPRPHPGRRRRWRGRQRSQSLVEAGSPR